MIVNNLDLTLACAFETPVLPYTFAKFRLGGKAQGANALIREYAKSVVSPSRLAAADWGCVAAHRKPSSLACAHVLRLAGPANGALYFA
jgi:hypothetical protein